MKTRLWRFTNYSLDFDYQKYFDSGINSCSYLAYGVETCPTTKRIHHQGFLYFSEARGSKKNVAKELGSCNVDMCKGSLDQNVDYCSKESELIEFGTKPKQGKRVDLDSIKDEILDGKISVDKICMESPMFYHQYGRTLNKLEDIALRKKCRTWMTKGIWYYGETGTGKSHKAFEDFNPATHYVYPNDNGWWDGYCGQEIVIINEFRGEIKYSELLDLLDKYPKQVKRRNREPMPFLAQKLIITSSLSPRLVYNNLSSKDSLSQLYRRIKLVEMAQKWSKGNTEP